MEIILSARGSGGVDPDTVFDTVFEKMTEKEGTGRHLPKSEFPHFTGTTELYGTRRNSRERCPLSNKIPLLRWAVTKVAVHLPYSFDLFGGRCHNQVRFLVFINEKTI